MHPSSSFSTFSRRAKNRPPGLKFDRVIAAAALPLAAMIPSSLRCRYFVTLRQFCVPCSYVFRFSRSFRFLRLFFGLGDNNKVEE